MDVAKIIEQVYSSYSFKIREMFGRGSYRTTDSPDLDEHDEVFDEFLDKIEDETVRRLNEVFVEQLSSELLKYFDNNIPESIQNQLDEMSESFDEIEYDSIEKLKEEVSALDSGKNKEESSDDTLENHEKVDREFIRTLNDCLLFNKFSDALSGQGKISSKWIQKVYIRYFSLKTVQEKRDFLNKVITFLKDKKLTLSGAINMAASERKTKQEDQSANKIDSLETILGIVGDINFSPDKIDEFTKEFVCKNEDSEEEKQKTRAYFHDISAGKVAIYHKILLKQAINRVAELQELLPTKKTQLAELMTLLKAYFDKYFSKERSFGHDAEELTELIEKSKELINQCKQASKPVDSKESSEEKEDEKEPNFGE